MGWSDYLIGGLLGGPAGVGAAYVKNNQGAKDWLFGGGATRDMASGPATGAEQQQHARDMLGRPAPTMNTGQSDQVRGQQQTLADMLMRTASGATPGAGEMAVNRQVGQAEASQTSQAQAARGANAALAQRTAARNTAAIGVDGAGQAAIAGIQDQNAATGQLGGLLGGMRGADVQIAGANQQAQMDQQKIQLQALAAMLGVDVATLQQDLAKRGLIMQDKGMLPGLLQAGGSILAASAGAPGG